MVLPALAAAQSIQDIPTVGRTGAPRFSTSFIERGLWLPPYGTREHDLWLRHYDRHERNGDSAGQQVQGIAHAGGQGRQGRASRGGAASAR